MKNLRELLRRFDESYRNRSDIERRMFKDAVIVAALSVYLLSPLPVIIINHTPTIVSLILVGVIPVGVVLYIYSRLKFYANLRKKQKEEQDKQSKKE